MRAASTRWLSTLAVSATWGRPRRVTRRTSRITLAACNWLPPPPSPPSPPSVAPEAPTGQLVTVEHSVQITLPASGDVTDFTPAILSNITAQFASQLNLDASRISVTVRAASVSIVVTIRADDEAAAGLQTTVSSAMSDMASAEAFLGDLPITLLAVPTVEKKVTYTFVPDPNASSGGGGGAAVAIIIILVVIAAFGCYYVRRKRKASGKYPWPINKVFPIVAEEEEAMERRRRMEFGSAPPPQQAQAYLASGGSSGAGAVATSAEAEAAGVVDEGAWRAPANRNPEFNPTLPPIPPRETTPQKAEAEEEPKYVMASEAAATAASSVSAGSRGSAISRDCDGTGARSGVSGGQRARSGGRHGRLPKRRRWPRPCPPRQSRRRWTTASSKSRRPLLSMTPSSSRGQKKRLWKLRRRPLRRPSRRPHRLQRRPLRRFRRTRRTSSTSCLATCFRRSLLPRLRKRSKKERKVGWATTSVVVSHEDVGLQRVK